MDAPREVAENVARAPKAWDSAHVRVEADAAVANLERMAADMEEAWKYSRAQKIEMPRLPDRIDIDGASRATTNSAGRPLAQDEEGVRNFWKWFGDSKVVDADGKPLVVYHGTASDFSGVHAPKGDR